MRRRSVLLIALGVLALGCDTEPEVRPERQQIESSDMPAVTRIVTEDIERITEGTAEAAELMAGGFVVEDTERREREMRSVMRRIREPPGAINSLMTSPISFTAAVDPEGIVIARDMEPDPMRGIDLAEIAPVVQRALDGTAGHELSFIPSADEDEPPSEVVIFAAPARRDGNVVGALVTGLPFWRLSQQMSLQLQLEYAARVDAGAVLWVLMYQGDETYPHNGFPPDLRTLAPDASAREEGLRGHEDGYTGQVQQFGRWYGYGVVPLPGLGEGIGAIVFRSDPV